jgi:hypothetical protein
MFFTKLVLTSSSTENRWHAAAEVSINLLG